MANNDLAETMSYLEIANRLDPNGDMAYLAQIITTKNTLFQYLQWLEANGMTEHHFSKVISEPSGTWTRANQDVPRHAARTAPARETIGTLEDYSYVDDRVLRRANNKPAARRSEDQIFLSGMMKEVADAFVNADTDIYPEKPMGLRYRSDYDAAADDNVIDAGGDASDCTSIWAIEMGGDGLYAVYPRNGESMMGIKSEDLAKQLVTSSTGSQQNWVTHFWFEMGIVIRQASAVQRLASVDATARSSDADIVWQSLIKMITNLPSEGGSSVIFMNKEQYQLLLIDAADKTNVHYTPDDPFGRKFLADFMGTPFARLDAIESTETAL